MSMRKLLTDGVLVLCVSALVSLTSQANEVIRKSVVMSDESGRTIEVVQVLRPNTDGSLTVLKTEPEQEATAFFNRACKDEYGSDAEYIRLEDNEVRISGTAGYTYSCKIEHRF